MNDDDPGCRSRRLPPCAQLRRGRLHDRSSTTLLPPSACFRFSPLLGRPGCGRSSRHPPSAPGTPRRQTPLFTLQDLPLLPALLPDSLPRKTASRAGRKGLAGKEMPRTSRPQGRSRSPDVSVFPSVAGIAERAQIRSTHVASSTISWSAPCRRSRIVLVRERDGNVGQRRRDGSAEATRHGTVPGFTQHALFPTPP